MRFDATIIRAGVQLVVPVQEARIWLARSFRVRSTDPYYGKSLRARRWVACRDTWVSGCARFDRWWYTGRRVPRGPQRDLLVGLLRQHVSARGGLTALQRQHWS